MAGHSHWAGIKHKKAANDAKRGKVFSKIARDIIHAAQTGGGDPGDNPRLRLSLEKARAANMPNDKIERAIARGTGELEGGQLEQFQLEGYGPGGVAFLVDVLTDNRKRTGPEVRMAFEKKGGNMGTQGSVAWMFEAKAIFAFSAEGRDEEETLLAVADAGADDLEVEEGMMVVTGPPDRFMDLRQALEGLAVEPESATITFVPKNTVELDVDDARRVLSLADDLEELDDVQCVTSNLDIPEELLMESGS